MCFVLFGCIRDRLDALRNLVQKGPKVRDVMSRRNFLQRMHPIHPIGPKTQVLVCFVLFGCILDLFRYCTKLGVERIELVQLMKKFVPRDCIRFFRNERTRSSPLDAKLMIGAFCSVWVQFG